MADPRHPPLSRHSSSSYSGKRRASTNPSSSSTRRRRQHLVDQSTALAAAEQRPTQQSSSSLSSPLDTFQVPPLPQRSQIEQYPPLSGAKVAIPRLRQDTQTNPPVMVEKHRVSHACEPCRQRKTKCSGERPICKHCEEFSISCVYADGKRDRNKR